MQMPGSAVQANWRRWST